MTVLETFDKFMEDSDAATMFITGVAGTGKTTSLAQLIEHCKENDVIALTVAYTHKAVSVLRSKLPTYANTSTLHSYLKKRPGINDKANKVEHIDTNSQVGTPEAINVLFVDEFSMIGERDFLSISELQYDEDGRVKTKVVYIGDPNQLPPVKDQIAVTPKGKYWAKLTTIHRQAEDNPLVDTLIELNSYLNGVKPLPLKEHETLLRGYDLAQVYKKHMSENKSCVILAFTNARVQSLNSEIQGRSYAEPGDTLFSPTTKQLYTFGNKFETAKHDFVMSIKGDIIERKSKYKTLDTLESLGGVEFYEIFNSDGDVDFKAVVFGHGDYQTRLNELGETAVKANKAVEKHIKQAGFETDIKDWSKNNWGEPVARARAKAWKEYLTFKENVICLDFSHAMTVHKSQGSTYDIVCLDTDDISKCANNDYTLYLKLLYVGISRASEKVYTN